VSATPHEPERDLAQPVTLADIAREAGTSASTASRALNGRGYVSEAARETANRYFPGEYELIPNGVLVPDEADPSERAERIVFVGRHESRKGLQVLLRAWPEVRSRTGARLRLIGADPLAVGLLFARLRMPTDGIDVASDIPGYRSVMEPDAGLLVPPGEPAPLADAIVSLLADEPRRQELGRAARAIAQKRYSWDRIAQRLAEIYEALVGSRDEVAA